jgi:hypothetical protein
MADGRQFYIDKNGLSIEIAGGGGTTDYEYIAGSGTDTYTITMDMTDADDASHIISRNGVILRRDALLSEVNTYTLSGQDIILAMALETGEYIQIYKI